MSPLIKTNMDKNNWDYSRWLRARKMTDRSRFVFPNDTGICLLECEKAFNGLTNEEKLYSHYLSQASWAGALICLYQTSPESPGIFLLLQKIFRCQSVEKLKEKALELGYSENEFEAFVIYVAAFYSNLGNYKSFGDTKFVPDVDEAKVELLIQNSKAYQTDPTEISKIWERVKTQMFSLDKSVQQLGLGDKGITTYFSSNCHTKDADLAQEFLDAKDLSGYNTRLFKYEENEQTVYDIRLASATTSGQGQGDGDMSILGDHTFQPSGTSEPVKVKVTRGDYSKLMSALVENLSKAQEHTTNPHETSMLEEYISSFTQGSITAHKEGSRHWIRNKGPIVETYIGFIENYRDPYGVRGEFEGFVAMVNKEMSAKFGKLVERAEHFLPLLPWPSSYEKDKFLRPDFTSLDVLSFGSSGIPAGINIPNYDDIRQGEGFKNVSLGNVLSSGYKDTRVTFLDESDKELYAKLRAPAFEVQVGLHELLGHGSGKLFKKDADGKLNFDLDHIKHTETGEQIKSWYKAGETFTSIFKSVGQPYEECRAECVGIYMCLSFEVLTIFGHEDGAADDIIYINWLHMVRAGLLALEFYNPETQTWGQAHMQARYVILRVLLEAGNDAVTVSKITGSDGEPDLVIHLDRSQINSTCKEAIGNFLRKLQTYKATADIDQGSTMFMNYSAVNDNEEPHFLYLRDIVIKRKLQRKMFVQCNTVIEDNKVKLNEYKDTAAGLIQSFVERYPDPSLDSTLQDLWDKDKAHFA